MCSRAAGYSAISPFDVVKHHLPTVHCYADETQLYVSFCPNDETGQDEAVAAVQRCVDDIRLWMTTDKLLLNDDKTEFVVMGTKQCSTLVLVSVK